MKNKDGVKFLYDKIEELYILSTSYAEAITKKDNEVKKLNIKIDEYLKKQDELFTIIKTYQTVLSDLESKPVPAKSILDSKLTGSLDFAITTGINSGSNISIKNNKATETIFAMVCKDTDEFIEYCDNLKKHTSFIPKVKNTIAVQSDGYRTFVKISSILDIRGWEFNFIIVLPKANKNPDFTKIITGIKSDLI